MRYVGGKCRIAKFIETEILKDISARGGQPSQMRYIEPFMGAGFVLFKMAPHFRKAIGCDAHQDLMLMWQAIKDGWDPPDYVSKEDYFRLKSEPPSALRGIVGFGSSFEGKWFGGYCDITWDSHWKRWAKRHIQSAKESLVAKRDALGSIGLYCCDYRSCRPRPGDVVYCDPPYLGRLGYPGTKFVHEEFYLTVEGWVDSGAMVYVSEESVPAHWRIVAETERKSMLRVAKDTENTLRRERIYCPVPR